MGLIMSVTTKKVSIVPATEVEPKAKRRSFTAKYKLEILKAADDSGENESGDINKLLRREGLYSSHLATWRKLRERGGLDALAPKQRGPKANVPDARDRRVIELEREIARLKARAERAEALVEIQKKVAALLGLPIDDNTGKR
jgi:transposase-like protein